MSADFGDLRARVLSAVAMIAVGAGALWAGGYVFAALAVVVAGLMGWELYRMLAPEAPAGRAEAHGLVAAVLVAVFSFAWGGWASVVALIAAAGIVAVRAPRDRVIFGAYFALIVLAGHGLIVIRALPGAGAALVLTILLIVIASDVGGYFGGRLIGGPKFWPRVSPKKTWSGTVVGWGLAVVAVWLFANANTARIGIGHGWVVTLGPLATVAVVVLAFVGQMGDIAESAIKRRYGVKDSSTLIPGHGGVLDRFDALIAVTVVVLILLLLIGAPVVPGPG